MQDNTPMATHSPVLAQQVAQLWHAYFAPERDEGQLHRAKELNREGQPSQASLVAGKRTSLLYVDATLGEAGHARLLLQQQPRAKLLGLDADPQMLERARHFLGQCLGAQGLARRCTLVGQRFGDYLGALVAGSLQADIILFDLGLSLFHYRAARGFSFRPQSSEEPLDMRLNPSAGGPSAADLIYSLNEAELADLFWRYGELHCARHLARAIVRQRAIQRLHKAQLLADFICQHSPRPRSKASTKAKGKGKHPATQVFQALRIAVGDELGQLSHSLPAALVQLRPYGLLAVISFHSLEDRLVKQQFRTWQQQGRAQLVYKKAVQAPYNTALRSERSAKLRIARRIA